MKYVCTRDKIRKATENPNKESLEPQIPSLAQLGRILPCLFSPQQKPGFSVAFLILSLVRTCFINTTNYYFKVLLEFLFVNTV